MSENFTSDKHQGPTQSAILASLATHSIHTPFSTKLLDGFDFVPEKDNEFTNQDFTSGTIAEKLGSNNRCDELQRKYYHQVL